MNSHQQDKTILECIAASIRGTHAVAGSSEKQGNEWLIEEATIRKHTHWRTHTGVVVPDRSDITPSTCRKSTGARCDQNSKRGENNDTSKHTRPQNTQGQSPSVIGRNVPNDNRNKRQGQQGRGREWLLRAREWTKQEFEDNTAPKP